MKLKFLSLIVTIFATGQTFASASLDASDVIAFNKLLRPGLSKGAFWRELATTHLAMHDAYNVVAPTYNSYAVAKTTSSVRGSASAEVAAITAGLFVARFFANEQLAQATNSAESDAALKSIRDINAVYIATLNKINVSRKRKDLGARIGQEVAELYLRFRQDDLGTRDYTLSQERGQFRLEDDAEQDSDHVWAFARPWTVCDFKPTYARLDVPELTSRSYIRDYNEVRCNGGADDPEGFPVVRPLCPAVSAVEHANRLEGFYVMDVSGTGTIQNMAERISLHKGLSFEETLRVYAGVNLALADVAIGAWTLRMVINHWRPASAIRNGLSEFPIANAPVEPGWGPRSGDIEAFPEFPSGNVSLMSAGTTWLAKYLDEDPKHRNRGYDVSDLNGRPLVFEYSATYNVNGSEVTKTRQYSNLWDIVEAIGESRILSGGHFRFATEAGELYGKRIARHVFGTKALSKIPRFERNKPILNENGNISYCSN